MPENDGNYLLVLGDDELGLALTASSLSTSSLSTEALAELQRVGLSLSSDDVARLARERVQALASTGRVELGQGALPSLVEAFAESPYVEQDALADQLSHIQAAFYQLRDGVDASVSDAEVARALRVAFDNAQGDLNALDEVEPADVAQAQQEPEFEGADLDASANPGLDVIANADPDAGWGILQNAPWSSCEISTADWR